LEKTKKFYRLLENSPVPMGEEST